MEETNTAIVTMSSLNNGTKTVHGALGFPEIEGNDREFDRTIRGITRKLAVGFRERFQEGSNSGLDILINLLKENRITGNDVLLLAWRTIARGIQYASTSFTINQSVEDLEKALDKAESLVRMMEDGPKSRENRASEFLGFLEGLRGMNGSRPDEGLGENFISTGEEDPLDFGRNLSEEEEHSEG